MRRRAVGSSDDRETEGHHSRGCRHACYNVDRGTTAAHRRSGMGYDQRECAVPSTANRHHAPYDESLVVDGLHSSGS